MQCQCLSAHAAALLLLPSFNRRSSHGSRRRQSIVPPQRRHQSHCSHPAALFLCSLRAALGRKKINASVGRFCLAQQIANAVTEKFDGRDWVKQGQAASLLSINNAFLQQRCACRNEPNIQNNRPIKLSKQQMPCAALFTCVAFCCRSTTELRPYARVLIASTHAQRNALIRRQLSTPMCP